MHSLLHPKRIGIPLAALAAIALVIAGAAYGLTSKSFTYSKAKTGYVIVSHMAFTPENDTRVYTTEADGGLTTTGGCFGAGLTLPAGAKVKSIQVFYRSFTGNMIGQLWRTALSNGSASALATVQPTDTSGAYRSSTGAVAAAKQAVSPAYSYGVLACEGPSDVFYGAKVKYTYTSAGS
jgi:hypothetical protein